MLAAVCGDPECFVKRSGNWAFAYQMAEKTYLLPCEMWCTTFSKVFFLKQLDGGSLPCTRYNLVQLPRSSNVRKYGKDKSFSLAAGGSGGWHSFFFMFP